jgi:hypothetical protein
MQYIYSFKLLGLVKRGTSRNSHAIEINEQAMNIFATIYRKGLVRALDAARADR